MKKATEWGTVMNRSSLIKEAVTPERKATNVHWHHGAIRRADRERLTGHKGFTIWFTGLSASGKSTLAVATEEALHQLGYHTYILDGDNVRHGLNKDLGFSPEDREDNIRRVSEVAKLFTDCGIINLTAFISPYRKDRQAARELNNEGDFIEAYVDCPLEICEARDPKDSYKKARAGMIKNFTGIDAPYEVPDHPEIHLYTDTMSVEQCVQMIIDYLRQNRYIPDKAGEIRGCQ
jgi:adenylylsulfate kinase